MEVYYFFMLAVILQTKTQIMDTIDLLDFFLTCTRDWSALHLAKAFVTYCLYKTAIKSN